ncbi:MAG TPA: IPTL-CTERM sorting domain-containing protein [Anaerolineales bacterium]|nr:IPTL-CTERM sorting domain-containing protein [Anaerolineales bacterium]
MKTGTGLFRTVQVLLLVAVLVVGMSATATAQGLNLDQCANDTLANLAVVCGINPPTWQNGNINGNNSEYREGDGLPYRNAITGITNGTWSVMVDYDFTQGGKFAVDRLTSFNLTQASNPCLDTTEVTCTVGSPEFAFTMPGEIDPILVDPTHPALPNSGNLIIASPPGGLVDTLAERSMTVWVEPASAVGTFVSAGSNCSVTPPIQSNSLNDGFVLQDGLSTGNSNRKFGFKFTLTGCPAGGCNVMLGWSGHISSSAATGSGGWGAGNGASFITGAPFHMRIEGVDQVCGTSGGNQDRSVQLSALVAPTQGTLIVIKHVVGGPNVAGDFTIFVNPGGISFPGAESPGGSANLAPGTYTVSESVVAGYNPGVFSGACNSSGVVSVVDGQTSTCTITNTFPVSTVLTVIKHVVGGTASADNFTMTITGPPNFSFPGAESPGITTNVDPGTYTVSESAVAGFNPGVFSGDCNSVGVVDVAQGESKTCTITNTAIVEAIPTLSEWAIVMMIMMLVGMGLLSLRRKTAN